MNATGSSADEVVISVQGTYLASDVKSHYDGGFPTFAITHSTGLTHFSWSGMTVPNNGLVHVGVELFDASIKFLAVTWKLNGVNVGCARQVNSLYGTHSSGTHQVEYANDVLNCAATTLYVGDLSLEYYDDPPPLADLNPTSQRFPIQIDVVTSPPHAVLPNAVELQPVPTPPSVAKYVLLVFKVGTSSTLAPPDLTHDFVLFAIEPAQPPPTPPTYCTAGTSTNGCSATLSATADPSVSLGNSCVITCSNVEGQKTGLLFYGLASHSTAWCPGGSSFLCVKAPTQRIPPQNSGGNVNSCDGAIQIDWDAYQLAHPNALGQPFSAGNKVYVQAWYRDPPACKTTNLSNGLELTYQP